MELGMRQKSERERSGEREREREEQQVSHDETRRWRTQHERRKEPGNFLLVGFFSFK
jgi:hypothetical protein